MKIITLTALAFGIGLGAAALADPDPLRANHPQRYTVVKGDTLWDIADRFLEDPWLWPEIWHVNPDIANPHLIYPGDVIKLVYVDGEPRLTVERGGLRTVKLSPQVRSEPIDQAIPTIPLDIIRPFLERPQVLSREEIDRAPYLVQSADEHMIAGAGDRIYVRGTEGDKGAYRYSVFRPGRTYRHPVTDEVLGYEAIYVADAVVERHGDPATMKLVRSRREARVGDRLLPVLDEELDQHFLPRPPSGEVKGHIIAVVDGVSQIGQYQVVVLGLGEREGMAPGHTLAVYQAGEEIRDTVTSNPSDTVRLPDERAGTVMVFRSFDRVSYALVMDATRAIHVKDLVRTP